MDRFVTTAGLRRTGPLEPDASSRTRPPASAPPALPGFSDPLEDALQDPLRTLEHQAWSMPRPERLIRLPVGAPPPASVQQAALEGIQAPATPLPHAPTLQRLFGRHDVRGIQAHSSPASRDSALAMNSRAFATGGHVVFAEPPDLHTAAHEAAHVVQQRGGLRPSGGVGRAGDRFERQADEVARRVVAGKSVEPLLDRMAGPGRTAGQPASGAASIQHTFYPVGPPPAQGVADKRSQVDVYSYYDDIYQDINGNQYTLTVSTAGDYLEKIKVAKQPGKDPAFVASLGGNRQKRGAPVRPIYENSKSKIRKMDAGDITAGQEIKDQLEALSWRSPHFGEHKQEIGKKRIRDKEVKRKGDTRGTGNDETMQTTLFPLLFSRDAGLSKDPDIRRTDVSSSGKEVSRLDFHAFTRTGTRSIPLRGGANYGHPGMSTQTPGGQDHNNVGNHELDSSRTAQILQSHGPVTEWGRAMTAQVNMQKNAQEILDPKGIAGYDPQGRQFSTDPDARNDLAYESGRNREIMKHLVQRIPKHYPNASPLREPMSPFDPNFRFDESEFDMAVEDPTMLPNLFGTLKAPKTRPPGWKYRDKQDMIALKDAIDQTSKDWEIDQSLCQKAFDAGTDLASRLAEYHKLTDERDKAKQAKQGTQPQQANATS